MNRTGRTQLVQLVESGLKFEFSALLALCVFLLTRPYIGIQHDARLYVGFALAKIDPNGIGRDLVFTADGQSTFSIFPALFLPVVKSIGPSSAAIIITLVGLVVWYVVLRNFVVSVFPQEWSVAKKDYALMIAFTLSSFYGGTGVLRFAEPYLTPRIYAEILVILALTLQMRGSRWFVLPSIAALAVHPLMAAPGIGTLILARVKTTERRVGLLGCALMASVVLIVASLALDATQGPLGRFDKAWLNVLNFKGTLVFLRYWHREDISRTLVHIVTISIAWAHLRPPARVLCTAVVGVSLLGVFVTFVGGDLAGHILLTQAQLWRSLWLLAVLGTVSLPIIIHDVWHDNHRHGPRVSALRKVSTLMLFFAWLIIELNAYACFVAFGALVIWYGAERWSWLSVSAFGLRVIGGLFLVLVVGLISVQLWVATAVVWTSPDHTLRLNWNYWLMTGVPTGILVVCALTGLISGRNSSPSPPISIVAAVPLVLLLLRFDTRSPYQRYVELQLDRYIQTGRALLPSRGRPIVWPFADLEPWAFSGSPSWGSVTQGIPAVFSRELALGWYSRWTFLLQNGLMPRPKSTSQIDFFEATMVAPCPSSRDDLADIALINPPVATPIAVPKLIQPATPSKPWQVQSGALIRRCL